jgi:hypothetical protein
MSFSDAVKRHWSPEGRFALAKALDKYRRSAMLRTRDNPIKVQIGEDTYFLHRKGDTDKMRVSGVFPSEEV